MFEARLKSDSCCDWTYVLNRKNADECYGGYKLLQNTDFNLNVPANFKQNVNLVIRHDFSPSRAVFKKVLFCEMIIRPAVKRLEPKRDSFLVLNYRSSYHLAKWRFEQLVRAKKHEMTNFLFILHIILACSEQATHSLRWLDWIFWGWYLPSLSINYVGMSKDIEKRLPQLYYIKMKIC